MLTLRPATPADAAYMLDLERRVMQDHAHALWGRFNPAPHPSAFDLANTRIVSMAGEPAGLLTVETAPDHLRLRKLYLEPQFQGRGHGTHLLAIVQAEAAQRGLPLRLSVLRPNQRALAFYLREGLHVAEETEERIFLSLIPPEYRADTVL
ncbi:MAG: GNAT family N-acetyltransferase [Paracoccaceae bacterium]